MAKSKITGRFNPRMPEIIPYFVEGTDALTAYNAVKDVSANGIWYDEASKTMRGSNLPVATRLDTLVQPLGMRVANLRDFSRPEIMAMVKGNHYSDAAALVLRSIEDSYEPNNSLITQLVPQVEQVQGTLKLPVLITGFDVQSVQGKEGYGFAIIPRTDFGVLHDERLEGKHNQKTFDTVDENGLPNFDKKGNRTWFARDSGLSRLYLNGDLDLGSSDGNLANSNDNGRIAYSSGWSGFIMKTYNKLYEYLYSMGNLTLAWRNAREGKSSHRDVMEFEKDLERNLLNLHYELKNRTYRPRPLTTFVLRDPKTRVISKSHFRDRVIHQALILVIGCIFERQFIYDSCANQVNKGTLFALKRLDYFMNKICRRGAKGFCLKADIKHYFDEINHEILLKIISRNIKDKDVIWLIRQILNNTVRQSGGGRTTK